MSAPTVVAIDEIKAGLARIARTQKDLAKQLGIARTGVYRRFNGTVPFTVDELAKTAELLNVPLTALLAPAPERASA